MLLSLGACGDDDGDTPDGSTGMDAAAITDTGPATDTATATDAATATDTAPAADTGPGPDTGPVDPSVVTVLTINLANPTLHGDWPTRQVMIADFIREQQPDVVAVQEAVEEGGVNGAELIAGMVGYEHRWERTHTLFAEGIGALSRWPIEFDDFTMLPGSEFGGSIRRGVMVIRVAHPDGDLHLFATHLTTDSDEDTKADQAVAVLEFIEMHPSMRAAFLGGDMNAEPDQLPMEVFRGAAMHDGRTGDLIDSWMTIMPGDPGLTHPSDAPENRIDYLYVVPGTAGTATVLSCEVVLGEPMGDVYASDHRGVLCRYDLEP